MQKALSFGALTLALSLLVALPAHAQAEGEEGAGATEESATPANPNERICRRVHVTGTNIPQRVCMSRAEWSELREESREAIRERQMNDGANTDQTGEHVGGRI